MRRPMMMLAMTALTAPLAAQDTSITIQRNNTASECTVRIEGRTLSEAEAKPICERTEGRTLRLRLSADSLRLNAERLGVLRLRELQADSLATFTFRRNGEEMAANAEQMARELRGLAGNSQRQLFNFFPTLAARPIIGVSIDPTPRETDRYGAYIQAVTPNGPADKAGIQSGDIITKLAGKEIGSTERTSNPEAQSAPSLKLIEVAGSLEIGKAVRIDFRRDGKNLNAQITPTDDRNTIVAYIDGVPVAAGDRWSPVRKYPTPPPPNAPSVAGRPSAIGEWTPAKTIHFEMDGPLAQLELAPVNEELGSYFGVKGGVLVVNAPAESPLALRAGDVVSAVDGRRIETPNELLRVLRSYDRDRTFTIQITRQKRQESVTAKLP